MPSDPMLTVVFRAALGVQEQSIVKSKGVFERSRTLPTRTGETWSAFTRRSPELVNVNETVGFMN